MIEDRKIKSDKRLIDEKLPKLNEGMQEKNQKIIEAIVCEKKS